MTLPEPPIVAEFESVMVPVELSTPVIVVPYGMPGPVMVSPATSPVVLLTPVIEFDPFSVPVKLTAPREAWVLIAMTLIPTDPATLALSACLWRRPAPALRSH